MSKYDEMLKDLRHYSKVGTGNQRVAAVKAAMEAHKLKESSVTDITGEPGGREITILGKNFTVTVSLSGDKSWSKIAWNNE